jgi:CHAD domain-containing protein
MTEASSQHLTQRLDGLVELLQQQIPQALQQFDEEAVHKTRVAVRRIKAAIDLVKPLLDKNRCRRFVRSTRRLRRRLGPLRDLDVMLNHLEKMRSRRHAQAVRWVQERLLEERNEARRRAGKRDAASRALARVADWWSVREQFLQAEPKLPALLAESLNRQVTRFLECAAALRAGSSADVPATQNPHEVRIAGRRLRYTVELAAAEGYGLDPVLMRIFKKMHQAIGLWHDYVVLTEQMLRLSLRSLLHVQEPDLHARVVDLSRFTLARAGRELKKFLILLEQHGGAIEAGIRRHFPPPAPRPPRITARRRDRGPSGSDGHQAPPAPSTGALPAA